MTNEKHGRRTPDITDDERVDTELSVRSTKQVGEGQGSGIYYDRILGTGLRLMTTICRRELRFTEKDGNFLWGLTTFEQD